MEKYELEFSEEILYYDNGAINEETLFGLLKEAYSKGVKKSSLVKVTEEYYPKSLSEDFIYGDDPQRFAKQKSRFARYSELNNLYKRFYYKGRDYSPEAEKEREEFTFVSKMACIGSVFNK